MTGVGKKYVYELASRILGDEAREWLDTPRTGLGDTAERDIPQRPRRLLESGCPACIDSVLQALERIEVGS